MVTLTKSETFNGTGNGHFGRHNENRMFRSEQVQDILSHRPGFLERWSFLTFVAILTIIVAAGWFIRYPDVIEANAYLTADNAPKEIVIRQDGRLIKLFAKNDERLRKGQAIGWIESTGDHKEVITLSEMLSNASALLARNDLAKASAILNRGYNNLGELQTFYQQFITALQQFNDFLITGYYFKRKQMLKSDLGYLKKMHDILGNQRDLAERDLRLSREADEADSTLFSQNVISKQDFRDQQSKTVAKRSAIQQLGQSLLINETAQIDKQKDIEEIDHGISQQKAIFDQAVQTLKSQAEDWKRKYIITAPEDGKIIFVMPLQENQFLQNNKTIGFINPPDSRFYAQLMLQQFNFGKADTGQFVQLRANAYPYQEFGFIPGKLTYISKIPSDSGFLATVELPGGLVTNYNKNIQYRNGLKLEALVITRNQRLLQRFFYNLIKTTSIH
jgi:multidrug efflux pump subunit AcrA (membrane-fusion protein)